MGHLIDFFELIKLHSRDFLMKFQKYNTQLKSHTLVLYGLTLPRLYTYYTFLDF